MRELKIFDKVKEGNYIVSLGKLVMHIERLLPSFADGMWEINNGAYGYGELVCSIEEELKSSNKYLIEGKNIFPKIKSEEEYFYNVRMKKVDSDFEIGIFDSTYLFIRCSNDKLIQQIGELYFEVDITEI